jgi:predicted TIM-barrel fold metal-dependent hydrolase
MWRFDKNWKAEHAAVPWLDRPPTAYIFEHVRSTTYPLEKLAPADLRDLLGMVRADRTLLFSGNYPSQEYGDPFEMIADFPDDLRRRVLVENALELYGQRLLAPNR